MWKGILKTYGNYIKVLFFVKSEDFRQCPIDLIKTLPFSSLIKPSYSTAMLITNLRRHLKSFQVLWIHQKELSKVFLKEKVIDLCN